MSPSDIGSGRGMTAGTAATRDQKKAKTGKMVKNFMLIEERVEVVNGLSVGVILREGSTGYVDL